MVEIIRIQDQRNWYNFLYIQKLSTEYHFNWIKLYLDRDKRRLCGIGTLNIMNKNYEIGILYSPFHRSRYDRIYIRDSSIVYNDEIHLYSDYSLCLYHPRIDRTAFHMVPLFEMIPWISEWIIFYEQWKKYGVWLGKEIKH